VAPIGTWDDCFLNQEWTRKASSTDYALKVFFEPRGRAVFTKGSEENKDRVVFLKWHEAGGEIRGLVEGSAGLLGGL